LLSVQARGELGVHARNRRIQIREVGELLARAGNT
jgi:hypothetical protein